LWEATNRRAERVRLEQKDEEAVERAILAVPGLVGSWRFQEARGLLEQTRLGLSEFAPNDTRARLEEVLGDVQLAEALDAIRLDKLELVEGISFDPARAPRYESAYKEHGLDCVDGDEQALAARMARSTVREALIGALDDWASRERDLPRREKLMRVARAADPDPWRDSFRAALGHADRAQVKERAAGADLKRLPPPTIATLGLALGLSTREAESLFRAAQPHHPTDFWINYYLGLAIYFRAPGRDGAAQSVSYFRASLVARPETAAVYNNLALALQKQGDLAGAAAAARRAAELRPDSASVHNTLGVVLSAGGDVVGAEKAYRRAIEVSPGFALPHRNLGRVLRVRGDSAAAEKSYRRAIELDPKDASAHNNLGNLFLAQGNRDEAEKEFRRAIERDPRMAEAHNNLGQVLHMRGDVTGSEEAVRRALELDRNYVDAHNNLGILLRERGDPAGAEKEYRRALELDPKSARVNHNIAQALVDLGRFDEARDFARVALSLFPPGKPWHEDANRLLQLCERMLALERRLTAVLRDEARPVDPAEYLALADVAVRKRRYAVAARLNEEIFSKVAAAPPGPVRYSAARAAALAGCGQGTDDVTASERARWRGRALEWLRAEFAVQSRLLIADAPKVIKEQARRFLLHWQSDPDLAGVRDSASLAAFPPDERAVWQEFWSAVAAALKSGAK
jgi:Flp pilus assembly protein TadD